MATAEEEHKMAVKLLVHKKQNKVIFAEANNDFADILFSFLTLPMGTIIRLLGEESDDKRPGLKVGSLTNLYKSVADLDPNFFSYEICKNMLLHPRNDAESECQSLKVKIEETEAPQYFRCDNYIHVSMRRDAPCFCGNMIHKCVVNKNRNLTPVFFYSCTTLIIGDDFSVMPSSPRIILELINRFGITDVKLLTERVVQVGKKEILNLLKCSLISRTPLTEAFIRSTGHQSSEFKCEPSSIIHPPKIVENLEINSNSIQQFTLKLLIRKSDNKVVFAEANEGFINQIFNLLTVPLGMAIRLLDGNSSLGSFDQLYASILNQDVRNYLISRDPPENNKLINPKVARHFCCHKPLLPLPIAESKLVAVVCNQRNYYGCELNPKLRDASTNNGGDFVKSPTAFIVTDDLVVKPVSSVLSLEFLECLNMHDKGLEEKVVVFGIDQAYKLLKSSLHSESALTQALIDDLLKTPKEEK